MKIAFNPSTVAALTTPPNNKDITFDLRGRNIFARGVKFQGTDTWRDIKINNVSIGSNTLDLRNGSNTTLTNTNGVVTINSTWRPVVDNLTSDSTTSSLSAKQGKVLKSLIDGKSNSGHTHDDRYLKLTGGTMASNALITFADSGSWGTDKEPQGARGGLYWTGQSDYAKLYAEETAGDNLDLVIQFGDDNSNGLSIRNKANTQTSYISAGGVITTGTFKGNLDWSYITNKPATATRWPSWAEVTGKPSSFTPSTHTHGLSNSVFFLNMPSISGNAKWKEVFGYPVNYNLLLSVRINSPAPEWCVGNYGSGILYGGSDTKGFMSSAYNEPLIMWAGGNGSSDDSVPKWYIGIKGIHKSIYNLATIASEANSAYNLRHSHANKSVLDGITSALVNNWNVAYTFVNTITGTDTDKVINKWDEIVNFLAGITEDNKLNTLLNSKLSIQQLSAKDILTTKTNNALFWVNTIGTASSITTGPFTDHPYALLSVTNYNQNIENSKFFYRSRLAFSSAGDIKVASCHHANEYKQDETWYNVLTSKNSGISGSTIKLNGTSITVYSSSTADGRYVKKSGDTMSGVLTIDTTNFGALIIKRNDDANGASIQFRGKSSVYGYIGLNNSTKDKQFLRWNSDTSKTYTILDTSSTYTSNGKGVINGTTITQVDNATNSTNSINARKLVNWYSARPTSLNTQFGDGSLRIFHIISSTTEGKCPSDASILHLAWDNNGGWDTQLALAPEENKMYFRGQNKGTWQPWKTLAFTTDIPSSLKNPYSLTTFGVVYDGSAAKTVTTSNFISQVTEGTSTITDGTMFITSYASNSGFADTNAVNVPYKRKAIHLWEYVKAKTDSIYATKSHNHDDRYVRAFGTSNDNIDSDWGQSFKTFDPIPSGTPPEQNPNISILNIGNNFNRRKQLAFIYSNDNIYYRRHVDSGFTNWRRLAFANEIPTSVKNPHALTISLNGTSQGPYDGSAAKNINITPGSIGAATSNHTHPYLPLSGGTVTGNIILKGKTSADMTYSGNIHPYIRFDNSDSDQNVSLIFTDYDTYRRPAGIKLVGNQGNEWFEAANIYATTFYGALSGNATTATTLQTPRTIWGQSFDGTANVSGNMSGVSQISFSNLSGTNGRALLYQPMADNDFFRIYVGGTASNSGFAEIATADDGNEPIYVRQYTGVFSSVKRTLTLLDANGYTHFPSYINIGGNENNNSSPDRVWGSNGSDSYLRSYRTSALRVSYANSADSATTASMLKTSDWNGGYYASSDTHYMCLGYMNCTGSYDSLTLLVTSAFWGNRHGSQDIITIQQSTNTNDTARIQTTVGRLRLGGSYERSFYYYKDDSRFRLYLYVYVTGGNSYGRWNISYLGGNATWVTAHQENVTKSASWIGIVYSAQVNYASSAGSATKVIVNQNTANDTNYPLVWSNQNNTNNATENQLYKSWSDLYYNPKNKRLTVGGSIYAAHFYESSDKTLKKNIKSILSSTNIPKIREFDWKDTGEHSYGFIAQELEEQGYGCLVSEVNGKKTVNYTATLALTVAKLQNLINIQNKKISNLTKELKALKYGRKKNS